MGQWKCRAIFRNFLLFYSLAFLTLFPFLTDATEKLVLTTGATAPWGPTEDNDGYLKKVAQELFRRINIEVEVFYLPPERVLANVNNGIEDGDLFRIEGMEKKYPNLVMIPESIADFEFSGFSLSDNSDVKFDDWPSLEGQLVGIMTGWKFYEKNVTENTHITQVSRPDLLIGLLRDGKVDVILFERWMGQHAAKKLGVKVRRFNNVIAILPMYIYLHKQHEALVPKISATLADMKKDGSLKEIHEMALSVLEIY